MKMTESIYLKPETEIVCISLKGKLLVDVTPGGTTSNTPLANQNKLFDGLDDDIDDNSPSDTDKSGLWDE